MRYFVICIILVLGLTRFFALPDETSAAPADLSQDLVGEWTMTELEGEALPPMPEPIRMKFLRDGRYFLVGPCHRSIGQFYSTGRGARLQATEFQNDPDCPSDAARRTTRRILTTLSQAAHLGFEQDASALVFFDRHGAPLLRLIRDE
jgi:hypothetical protein